MKRVLVLFLFVCAVALTAYGAITLYDYNFKVGRMWETPGVKPHEEPILLMPAGVVPTHGGETAWRVKADADILPPSAIAMQAPEMLKQGQVGYRKYCVHCHGKYYDGNGTVGQSFAPLPGDLRSAKVQQMPEGKLFREISDGFPGGRQPALATTIPSDDRWRIIAYVKSLGLR